MRHAVTDDMVARQAALEAEMVSRGINLSRKQIGDAKAKGQESATPYGSYLVRRAIAPVAQGIRKFITSTNSGKAGRRHVAAAYLRDMNPDVIAFLALRACLNLVSAKVTLQNGAIMIARQLETEARLAHFEKENPDEYKKASKATERARNERYKRTVFSYIAGKNEINFPAWPKRDKLLIGQKLLDIIIETTGYIEIVQDYKSLSAKKARPGAYTYHIIGTAKCLEWITRMEEYTVLATPEYLPAIIPPRPWTSPHGGGYYTLYKPLTLVKNGPENYLEELSLAADDMPDLYRAINAMQETGYRINKSVMKVMRQLWNNGGDVAGIPNREAYTLPRCPVCGLEIPAGESRGESQKHPCFDREEVLKAWKKEAALVYEKNVVTLSKRIQFARTLQIAERFQDETIYFPMQLDFRGRVYAVPSFLNPQGADVAKGLLLFAEGKPLDSPEAVDWLAVRGANSWGNDKVSLADRVAWVRDHETEILAVAADPYSARMWHDADKPWLYLAFCFEWGAFRAAEANGETFVSSLPVDMDGTCNGLQIFSLLLRDPVGGAATNLLPADKPQDIYQVVADKTILKLHQKAETGVFVTRKHDGLIWYDEKDLARRILSLGINRKTTKRSVMVLPYGGTHQACCEYTLDHLTERLEGGEGDPESINPDNLFAASRFLAGLIWASIGETVIAAKAAMSYLQELAALAASEGLPVVWQTPIGFLVSQAYYDMKEYRVKSRLGSSIIRLTLREEGEERTIDKRRQRNGISPNFVHSLDAAAMCRSISLALNEGITSYMMIHDSYGVPAADAAAMARCLRTAFVGMFTERDVLAELRDAVAAMLPETKKKKLPPLPPKGTLDITKVLQSTYFFA